MKRQIKILSTALLRNETKSLFPEVFHLSENAFIQTKECAGTVIKQHLAAHHEDSCIVVFTSVHAIEAVSKLINTWPAGWQIACAGKRTSDAANARFPKAMHAAFANNAKELAAALIPKVNNACVLYCCGNMHLPDLPCQLRAHGIMLQELIVYNTLFTPHKIQEKYSGILFFSPSAAQSYFSINQADKAVTYFANGESTKNGLLEFVDENSIVVIDVPGQKELVLSCINYFEANPAALNAAQ